LRQVPWVILRGLLFGLLFRNQWEELCHWLLGLVAGDRIRTAGGTEAAAELELRELGRVLLN
jgi:hypothetical protein